MSGVKRLKSGELAYSKSRGKKFVEEQAKLLSPESLEKCDPKEYKVPSPKSKK